MFSKRKIIEDNGKSVTRQLYEMYNKKIGIVTENIWPVLLVINQSKEVRIVVDYYTLNNQTIKEVFPTLNMEDSHDVLVLIG